MGAHLSRALRRPRRRGPSAPDDSPRTAPDPPVPPTAPGPDRVGGISDAGDRDARLVATLGALADAGIPRELREVICRKAWWDLRDPRVLRELTLPVGLSFGGEDWGGCLQPAWCPDGRKVAMACTLDQLQEDEEDDDESDVVELHAIVVWDLTAESGVARVMASEHRGDLESDDRCMCGEVFDEATSYEHGPIPDARRCPLTGHASRVTHLSFSPDGSTLVSCSIDQTMRLWDVATMAERCRWDRSGKDEFGPGWASFSPDGSRLVTLLDGEDLAHGIHRADGLRVWTLGGGGSGGGAGEVGARIPPAAPRELALPQGMDRIMSASFTGDGSRVTAYCQRWIGSEGGGVGSAAAPSPTQESFQVCAVTWALGDDGPPAPPPQARAVGGLDYAYLDNAAHLGNLPWAAPSGPGGLAVAVLPSTDVRPAAMDVGGGNEQIYMEHMYNRLRVLDVASGRVLGGLDFDVEGMPGGVLHLDFDQQWSPAGSDWGYVLCEGGGGLPRASGGRRVEIWSVHTGRRVWASPVAAPPGSPESGDEGGCPGTASFAPDGRCYVTVAPPGGTSLTLWH